MFKNVATNLRKVLVATATAALAFSGLSASPAQAAAPVYASGDSVVAALTAYNYDLSNTNKIQVPANSQGGMVNVDFQAGVDWMTANVNKVITATATVLGPNGQAIGTNPSDMTAPSVNVNPSFSFCDINASCQYGSNPYTPGQASVYSATVQSGQVRGTLNVSVNFSGGYDMNLGVAQPLPVGEYTVTVQIKADGVASTVDGTDAGLKQYNARGTVTVSGSTYTPATAPGSVNHDLSICLDTTKVQAGSTVTSKLFVNDVEQTGMNVQHEWYWRDNSGMSSRMYEYKQTTTITADDITNGLRADLGSYGDFTNKTVGTTYVVTGQLVDANGADVSGSCAPTAPGKPTITPGQSGSLSAAFTNARFAEMYECAWYLSTDLNTPVKINTAMPGMGMPGSSQSWTCALSSPVVGSSYVVKVRGSYYLKYGPYSASSDAFQVSAPGYTVSPAISGATTAGKISQVSNSISSDSTSEGYTVVADGTGGALQVATYGTRTICPPNCVMPNPTFKLTRSTATAMDSAFAGTGSVTWDPAVSNVYWTSTAWYGTGKWTMTASGRAAGSPAVEILQGSYGSATTSTITVGKAPLEAACASIGTGFNLKSYMQDSSGTASMFPVSARTAKQYYVLNCWKEYTDTNSQKYYPTTQVLVTVDDATHVNVIKVFGEDSADVNATQIGFTSNQAATGSDVAITFFVSKQKVTAISSGPSGYTVTGTVAKREIVRLKADGTTTTTNDGWVAAGTGISDAPVISLPLVNSGDFYAIYRSGSTSSLIKVTSSGAATAPVAIVNDKAADLPSAQYIFPLGVQAGSLSDISVIARSQSGSVTKTAIVSVKTATAAGKTGEILSTTFTTGNGMISAYVLDAATKDVIWWHANAATANKFTLYKWRDPLYVPVVVVPTVTTQVSGKGLNTPVAGTKLTITGTNLGEVTAVKFGTVTATIGTRSATSLEVTVPTGTTGTASITLVYSAGTVTAGSYKYLGATKLAQAVTLNAGATTANIGDTARTLSATVAITGETATPSLTFSSTTTSICTVAGTTLNFVAKGTCTVKAVQAASAWAAEGVATATITVAGKVQTVTITAPTTAEKIIGTSYQLKATSSSGLALAYASNNASNCSVSSTGSVKNLVATTCVITVSQAGNGTWAAASAQVTYTVTKKVQTVTVAAPSAPEKLVSVEGVFLYGSATSGGALTYSFSTPTICNKGTYVANHVLNIKAGTCTIVVSQAGNATWAASSTTVTYTVGAAGSTAIVDAGNVASPVTLLNNGTKANVLSEVVFWNKTTGALNVSSRGVWVGPITATATFKIGSTNYTCQVSYGTQKAVTDATANQVKGFPAANLCGGTSVSDKAALAALKKITAPVTVKVVIVRDLRSPANYNTKGQNTTRTIYFTIN
ncbi:MAG: IPT/TIG domain-containing protein [Microbacteriaceae bacterium]